MLLTVLDKKAKFLLFLFFLQKKQAWTQKWTQTDVSGLDHLMNFDSLDAQP